MLTEESVVDQITVDEYGNMSIRTSSRIFRDGEKIAETYHRHVCRPGDDTKDQHERVKAIADKIWTKEVIDARIEKDKKVPAVRPT